MYYNVCVKMALMKTVGFQCESKSETGMVKARLQVAEIEHHFGAAWLKADFKFRD